MNYKLEGNEFVVKQLFGEKRYAVSELTRICLRDGIYVYKGETCIAKCKGAKARGIEFFVLKEQLYRLAIQYNMILEGMECFEDEIELSKVHQYGEEVISQIKAELQPYVEEVLGKEYELRITPEETKYYIILYINVYRDGIKMCMDDVEHVRMSTEIINGRKQFHMGLVELVMAEYINPITQESRITKYVNYEFDIKDAKEEIDIMKQYGVVPAASFEG